MQPFHTPTIKSSPPTIASHSPAKVDRPLLQAVDETPAHQKLASPRPREAIEMQTAGEVSSSSSSAHKFGAPLDGDMIGDERDMAQEAINTPFCSLQEILRGLGNISEAP